MSVAGGRASAAMAGTGAAARDAGGSARADADDAGGGANADAAIDRPAVDAGSDAGPEPECSFSGELRIEPGDVEVAGAVQLTLVGNVQPPTGCVQWRTVPSSFSIFGSRELNEVVIDAETGELEVSNLPNDVSLWVIARIGSEDVAMTTVRYYDPRRALSGVFREIAVLRCPDYVEMPREQIQEIMLEDGFQVTFQAFETYVDYAGASSSQRDPTDPRGGSFSFSVDWANFEPETLITSGRYVARNGVVELRDLWLGPDEAQCGHVLERFK